MKSLRTLRPLPFLSAALVTTIALSGCSAVSSAGSADSEPTSATAKGDDSLASLVPEDIRSKGVIVVGTDPTYPPFEELDAQKKIVGLDPDILTAVGDKLDIKIEFTKAAFDSIIPGLKANRYDMAMSAMTDTPERQKEIDFVDYFMGGGVIVMKKGDAMSDKDDDSHLCGAKVGIQTGTIQAKRIPTLDAACTKAGKPKLEVRNFASVQQAALGVTSGRIDYVMTNNVNGANMIDANKDSFVMISDGIPKKPAGMVFAKDDTQLRDAIEQAFQAVIDDGTYADLMKQYGLEDGMVEAATVNAGTD